jgi:hypothetical protein
MILVTGLVLLALGLLCGAALVLAPLGFLPAGAGLTMWILFPAFTIGGYLLAAAQADDARVPLLSRISGGLLLALALAAAVVLVLEGGSIIELAASSTSLWYVLALGLLLGATGVASHRKLGGA